MEVGPRRDGGPTHTKGAIVNRSLKRLRRSQLPTPRLTPWEAALASASSYCRSQINFIKEHM
jgi:hypothetical protein